MKMGQEWSLRRSNHRRRRNTRSAWCQEHQGKRVLKDTGKVSNAAIAK